MNAKQTEDLTGISRRNLRFYEDRGLIHPSRNPDNDYRDYSEEDIKTLKTIRAMRMLDISLEEIHLYIKGEKSLDAVAAAQEQILRKKQKDLENAIRFCQELRSETLFSSWVRDYQSVARAEAQKHFSFVPDDEVTTPQEFSMALFQYADQEKKNLVITKESLEPEFEINGIAYTAQRIYRPVPYGLPVAVIDCDAVYPEDFQTEIPTGKRRVLTFLYRWWWAFLIVGVDGLMSLRFGVTEIPWLLLSLLPSICTVVIISAIYRSRSR